MNTGWRLGRRPGLDGLRGVAILLVLVCHLFYLELGNAQQFRAVGAAGVSVFFTLSGFLITALLVEERATNGRVSLGGFYARRARRLFPALATVLAAGAVLQWVIGVRLLGSVWPIVLYVANWKEMAGANLGAFGDTWSLSIEEQFYMVWPLLLIASMRWRRGPVTVAVGGIVVSTVLRLALMGGTNGGDRVYFGSDTQASTLLVGCLLALLAYRGLRPWRVPAWAGGVGAFALVGFIVPDRDWVGSVLVPTVVPLVAAAVIWMVCSTPGGPLAWGWLRWVGRRSYAIYLWHGPMLGVGLFLVGQSVWFGLLMLATTLGVAEVSWRLVEQPVLRRGRRVRGETGVRQLRREDQGLVGHA